MSKRIAAVLLIGAIGAAGFEIGGRHAIPGIQGLVSAAHSRP